MRTLRVSFPWIGQLCYITALSAFWLWFGYQHGFANSPDSWYRGLLGKSIVEGHPYFVNLIQDWHYDLPQWSHSAVHEPLLPVIYALYFLFFGYDITIANYVSCLSAALLIWPLILLSKRLFGSALPGFIIYVLTAFNNKDDYLFEVFAGLSLPTTLLLLVCSLVCLLRLLESEKRRWVIFSAIFLAGFFYTRGPEQLIFLWTMALTSILGWFELPRAVAIRLLKVWSMSFVLVLPWMIRKTILFGSPTFTHGTTLLWTDRGYDCFTYHEHMPYPSMSSYFGTHSVGQFAQKILLTGPAAMYSALSNTVIGPAWIYLLATVVFSSFTLFFFSREKHIRFFFCFLSVIFIGYLGMYALSPFLDSRHFIPIHFIITFFCISALSLLVQSSVKVKFLRKLILSVLLLGIVYAFQKDFWLSFPKTYLKHTYSRSMDELKRDPTISSLKKRFSVDDVILGPFAGVQRLSFATGLSFIEQPDNLTQLVDPAAFFRRYNIRYSLVNVTQILPPRMIKRREILGNEILFVLDLDEQNASQNSLSPTNSNHLEPTVSVLKESLISKSSVYIDAFHGSLPDTCFFNTRASFRKIYSSSNDFIKDEKELLGSDILIVRYGNNEFQEKEIPILEKYIQSGGKILLMSHGWVWISYGQKTLDVLPANVIGRNFGMIISGSTLEPPLKVIHPLFNIDGLEPALADMKATFSDVVYGEGEPLLVGKDNKTGGLLIHKGRAKVFVWGHDSFLSKEFACSEPGATFVTRVFEWLLSEP